MSGTLVTAEMTEIKHVSNVKKLNHSLPLCQNIVNGIYISNDQLICNRVIHGFESVCLLRLICRDLTGVSSCVY
jgi:hypothetical protein